MELKSAIIIIKQTILIIFIITTTIIIVIVIITIVNSIIFPILPPLPSPALSPPSLWCLVICCFVCDVLFKGGRFAAPFPAAWIQLELHRLPTRFGGVSE
jgi:hypothetical protein